MRVSDISNYDYDQDFGNADGWVSALKAEGVEAVIIGSQNMDKARWQLARCREAGMSVIATYAEPNVDTAIALAHEAGALVVCIVCEPGGIQDFGELKAAVQKVRNSGLLPVLYGNRGDITAAIPAGEMQDVGLWFASYFDDHHVVTGVPWWPKLWGHQYTSTAMIAGKNRDLSEVFVQQEEQVMESYRRGMVAIANGPGDAMLASYDAFVNAGFAEPLAPPPGDNAIGDMNAYLVRRQRIMVLAVSDSAETCYKLVGG